MIVHKNFGINFAICLDDINQLATVNKGKLWQHIVCKAG